MTTKLTRTVEVKRENLTFVVTAISLFMIGNVSQFGKTYFQIKLKHSNEGVGYAKMTKETAKRIINHTEENAKFFI
jgi:hypothetical protein